MNELLLVVVVMLRVLATISNIVDVVGAPKNVVLYYTSKMRNQHLAKAPLSSPNRKVLKCHYNILFMISYEEYT